MRKNSLSKDIIKFSETLKTLKLKHNISTTPPTKEPTIWDKMDDCIRAAYIDAIIDEEIEKTTRGLR